MANELNIDKLSIEIEADSSNASGSIDRLSTSLNGLKNAVAGVKGLNSIANSLNKLSVSANQLNNTQFSSINSNINKLCTSLGSLKNIGGIDKSIATTINSLSKLDKVANNLNTMNFTKFITQIQQLSNAMIPLTQLGKSNLGSIFNQLGKLPATVQILGNVNFSKFAQQMQQLANAMTPVTNNARKMSTVFSRLPNLVKSTGNQFNSYGNTIRGSTKATTSFFGKISKIISSFRMFQSVVMGATSIFSTFFKSSSAYIEDLNLFNVAMGSTAKSAMQFAQKVQNAMNIDMGEWMQYQGAFNMLITGFGVSSDKAQIMSQNLTQLAYDYSSLKNIDVKSAFSKLNSAMSGQIKGLKDFGNNVSVAMVKETGLKYGLQGAVSTWDQNTQAIMRYITIMNNASKVDVFNDMARTINTPANAVRILTQQFAMLKRAIGGIASVIATTVIPYIQMFVQLATEAANFIAKLMGFELPKIDYSGLTDNNGLADVEDDANTAGNAVDSTTDKVKKLKKQLMGFDELNIINAPDKDSSKGNKNKGNGGKTGIGNDIKLPEYDFLKGLDTSANKRIENIKKKLAKMFEPVKKSWEKYGKVTMESFKYKWSEIGKLTSSIGKSFAKVWQNGTGEKTVSTILKIVTNINTAIGNIAKNFRLAWEKAGTGTKIIQNVWDTVNILLEGVEDITYEFSKWSGKLTFSPILESVKNLTSVFKNLASILVDKVKWAWTDVLQPLAKWSIEEYIPAIVDTLADALDFLGTVADGLITGLECLWDLTSWARGIIKIAVVKTIQAIGAGFKVLNTVFKVFKPLVAGVSSGFAVLITAVKGYKLATAISSTSKFGKVMSTLVNTFKMFKKCGVGITFKAIIDVLKTGNSPVAKFYQTYKKLNTVMLGSKMWSGITTILTNIGLKFGALKLSATGASVATNGFGTALKLISAHPLLAVATAIAGVVTALAIFKGGQKSAKSETQKMNEELKRQKQEAKDLADEVKNTKDAMRENVQNVSGEYEIVLGYVDKLEKLTGKDGVAKNVGEAKFYAEKINEILPGSVKITKDGKVIQEKTTEEIKKQIEYEKQKAIVEAKMQEYAKAKLEYTKAETQYNENKNTVDRLKDEKDALYETILAKAKSGENTSKLQTKYQTLCNQINDTEKAMNKNKESMEESDLVMQSCDASAKALSGKYKDLANEMVIDLKLASSDHLSSFKSMGTALDTFNSKLKPSSDEYKKMTYEQREATKEAKNIILKDLIEMAGGYDKSYTDIIKTLKNKGIKISKDDENLVKELVENHKKGNQEIKDSENSKYKFLSKKQNSALNKLNKEQKNKLDKYVKQFQKSGDKSGEELCKKIANSIDKDGKVTKKTEELLKDVEKKVNGKKVKSKIDIEADKKKFDKLKKELGNIPGLATIKSVKDPETLSKLEKYFNSVEGKAMIKSLKDNPSAKKFQEWANKLKGKASVETKKEKKSSDKLTTWLRKLTGNAEITVDKDTVKKLRRIIIDGMAMDIEAKIPGLGEIVKGSIKAMGLYASGGFPDMGEMFIAREAGPELVGRIGRKTTVANNDQIVSGISAGVYNAVVSALSGKNGSNNNITVKVYPQLDGRTIGESVVKYNNGIVSQTGKTPFKF